MTILKKEKIYSLDRKDKIMLDDISYFWTTAEASVQKAMEEGKIKVSCKIGKNVAEYNVKAIFFDQDGNMDIRIDSGSDD